MTDDREQMKKDRPFSGICPPSSVVCPLNRTDDGEQMKKDRPGTWLCPPSSVVCPLNQKPPAQGRGLREELAGRTSRPSRCASGHFEVLRRCLAAIGHELVLDRLAFIERAEASALDRRDMDEHVLVAGGRPDEPVAFSWIEPFDGAFLHRLSPSRLAQ